jgi:hypothetical protein
MRFFYYTKCRNSAGACGGNLFSGNTRDKMNRESEKQGTFREGASAERFPGRNPKSGHERFSEPYLPERKVPGFGEILIYGII